MTVVSMLSARPNPETEIPLLGQLVVTLSGRLARVHFDGIAPVVVETLDQVVATTCSDACHLIEFTEYGPRVYASSSEAPVRPEPVVLPWLSERLARGEQVVIAGSEVLAGEGNALGQQRAERRPAPSWACRRPWPGEVVCALVLDSARFAAAMAAAARRTSAAAGGDSGRRAAARPRRERAARPTWPSSSS